MDLLSEEGVQEVRRPIYRVSIKLLCLQERLHMSVVSLRHVSVALCSVGGANLQLDARLNHQEVTRTLSRMFHLASQEVEVDQEAVEEICNLTFRLFDRTGSGCVSAASLETLLIVLSGDSLQHKYTALVGVAQKGAWSAGMCGSISRSGLESLLRDLSEVPVAVQEVGVSSLDAAVTSCFNQVTSQSASPQQVMSWLRAEPPLLQWLPLLSRLSSGRHLRHDVRCHCCKTRPLTGLRYRCVRCVNVQVCQSCFLTDRHTKRHKKDHPVLELSTQPTWRESLTSLVRSSGHALLPRRRSQRGMEGTPMWAESPGTSHRTPPPPDSVPSSAAAAVSQPISHDALCSSKCVQTEEQQVEQTANLLTDVRDLQRDKWLLEQQLRAWKLSVQSEQGFLEERCAGVEETIKALRRETTCLQGLLTQVMNKAAEEHTEGKEQKEEEKEEEFEEEEEEGEEFEEEEEGEEFEEEEEEVGEEEAIQDRHNEREAEPEAPGQKEVWQREVDLLLLHQPDAEEQEDEECSGVSVEQRLQQTVVRLRTELEVEMVDRWSTSEGSRKGAELLETAGQVGASIHHLVTAVRTTTNGS